jgi:hypothetical protein
MEREGRPPTEVRERPMPVQILVVTCSEFGHGQRMPFECVRDGENRSPALRWKAAPEGTRSYALICDDPDAPREEPFVHWLLYGIPAGAIGVPLREIPGGISKGERPGEIPGALQGRNDFGDLGYDGPQPPQGHGVHHYHFKLFALDAALPLRPGLRKPELLRELEGHVLATGHVIGTYSR